MQFFQLNINPVKPSLDYIMYIRTHSIMLFIENRKYSWKIFQAYIPMREAAESHKQSEKLSGNK